ncbi:MAG: phage tail protein [Cytophagales bacterium]|nr:MAG: phage tail protein [Cytophagales bacterium]
MLNNIPAFSRPTLYPGFYFKVSIVDEKSVGSKVSSALEQSFEEVTGLSFTIESDVQFYNTEHCAIPTKVTYSPLVLKRAFVSPTSELLTWCTESIKNNFTKITLKTIVITLMNVSTGLASAEWKVYNAYPLKYQVDGFNSNQSQLLMETIEIRYQRFEVIANRASTLANKAVSALNSTKVGRDIVNNLTTRKDNAIKNLKDNASKKANDLLNKLTPDFLKTKIDPTKAVTDPNELARLKKLAEQAAKKAKAEEDKKAADDAAAAKKAADEEAAKKAEEDKKVAMAKKLAEEAAKKLTETKPEPKEEEKKTEPKKEEKKTEPKKEEKKTEPKKEEKKTEPKKEEKKTEPKKEEKKPEPKKEEKPKPKTAKERVAERQKAAEKKHIENQQKGRDNKNKGGKQ